MQRLSKAAMIILDHFIVGGKNGVWVRSQGRELIAGVSLWFMHNLGHASPGLLSSSLQVIS